AQPQVVQVWYLPNTGTGGTAPTPAAVQIIHGTAKLEADTITWIPSENATLIRGMFNVGGQVLLRVHCGHLFDRQQRPVSAALTAVTPFPNKLPVYGGIFETWFFVAPG